MYYIFIRFMLARALLQFGISYTEATFCQSRKCAWQLEEKSRDVLKIDWKPISVFPEEAGRFKK